MKIEFKKLKAGQSVFFNSRDGQGGQLNGFVFDGPEMKSQLGTLEEIPQDLHAFNGTLEAFMKAEVSKYGLTASSRSHTPYKFDLA